MSAKQEHPFIQAIFFGNYFYSICALALIIEATLQQKTGFSSLTFYVLIFLGVIVYYTHAYRDEAENKHHHLRQNWYSKNKNTIRVSQLIYCIALAFLSAYYFIHHFSKFSNANLTWWISLLAFPTLALLYNGAGFKVMNHYSLRRHGWLKPFLIGFIWAGCVTLYPKIIFSLESETVFQYDLISILLFVKNWMFISLLCIMFDVKDYADDYNQKLKTFVHQFGLRNTILYVITPLSILGLGSYLFYGIAHNFSCQKLLL